MGLVAVLFFGFKGEQLHALTHPPLRIGVTVIDFWNSVNLFRTNFSILLSTWPSYYGVATISRLLKIIGLFCRISSLL